MTNDYPRSEPKEGSQSAEIIKYLETGKTLTGLEALKLFGTMKLASRISEICACGYDIKKDWFVTDTKKRVRLYYI